MNVPGVAVLAAVRDSVEFPGPVTEAGLKLALTLVGKPDAAKATVPVKPLTALTCTMNDAVLPGETVWDVDVVEIEKSEVAELLVEPFEEFIACPNCIFAASRVAGFRVQFVQSGATVLPTCKAKALWPSPLRI